MINLKRISVFLDLSPMDTVLLRYAAFLCKEYQIEKIAFCHVFEARDLPENFNALYPELDISFDRLIITDIQDRMDELNVALDCPQEIKIFTEENFSEVIQWQAESDIDLILVGRKPSIQGSNTFSFKMAKLASAAVMLIPETYQESVEKVLIPVDFSHFSKTALELGDRISSTLQARLYCQHVFHLPSRFFPYFKEKSEDIQQESKKSAEKKLASFTKKHIQHQKDVVLKVMVDDLDNVARTIYNYAIQEGVDLIIMGPKGSSHGEYLLLGGVAEKLLLLNTSIKVVIAKDKKEHESLFSEIFG